MTKKALITGITGQDGSYLAEYLLEQGYEVIGMVRRTSTINFERIMDIQDKICIVQGDLLDPSSLVDILREHRPTEVYNLAAQSFIPTSFKQPVLTGEFTALGVTRVLEAIRIVDPQIRFYQASSSVDGQTPVLIRRDGVTQLVPIAELLPPEPESGFVVWPLQGVEILTVDDNANVTFAPVSHVSRHTKNRLYTLKYKGGGEIRITGDHSVIIFGENGEMVAKRVDELKVGDYLITYNGSDFPRRGDGTVTTELKVRPEYRSRVRGYREEVPVNADLMKLLGFYLAEGHCNFDPPRKLYGITLTFHLNEEGYAAEVKRIVLHQFPDVSISERLRPEVHSRTIAISGKMIASLCAQFGKTAREKHLPSWLWDLEPALITSFLQGYLGDAQIKPTEIAYTTTSSRLAQELIYLMRNAGLGCRIYRRVNKPHQSPQGIWLPEATCYDIKVSSRYASLLANTPEARTVAQQTSLECLPSRIFRKPLEGSLYHRVKFKPLVSKGKVRRLLRERQMNVAAPFDNLLNSHLGVARIAAITSEEGHFHVYDVAVPQGQRFFGGVVPVLLHNSEMFGKVVEVPQSEKTPFYPRSPYGVAKLYGHWITINYRESYDIFAVSGILFNHECVTADTPVITRQNGLIDILPIEDIVPHRTDASKGTKYTTEPPADSSLEVWDAKGWTRVTCMTATWNGFERKPNKVVHRVAARGAVYHATSDHTVFACDGDQPVERPAGEITVGDRLALINLPAPTERISMTDDEAWLLGILAAEGYVSPEGQIQVTNQDEGLLNEVASVWSRVAGGNSYRYRARSGFPTGQPVVQLYLRGRNEYGRYIHDSLYTRTDHKRVPLRVLNASHAARLAFLRGFNAGDGLKSTPCTYEFQGFKTNSAVMAAGLYWLTGTTLRQRAIICLEEREGQLYYQINLNSPNVPGGKGQHLQRPIDEVVKAGPIEYPSWLFDLATESGTFHAGVGQGWIHNSPRRGLEFSTHKVTFHAAKIALGLADKLPLGNLDAQRDWGWAPDYVRAMHLMLQQGKPEDYVIATGRTHSIRRLCELAFGCIDLDWQRYVFVNPADLRPADVDLLIGDATKARTQLGWQPTVSFERMIELMVQADIAALKKQYRL